jgi:hypothetical protein
MYSTAGAVHIMFIAASILQRHIRHNRQHSFLPDMEECIYCVAAKKCRIRVKSSAVPDDGGIRVRGADANMAGPGNNPVQVFAT